MAATQVTVKSLLDTIADKSQRRDALAAKVAGGEDLTEAEHAEYRSIKDIDIPALNAKLELVRDAEAAQHRSFTPAPHTGETGNRDISESDKKDVASYSIVRAIQTRLDINNPKPLTGIEKEMHEEAVKEARSYGKTIDNIGIPSIVAKHPSIVQKRDASVTAGTQPDDGSATITTPKVLSLDDMLRNALVVNKLGARYRNDLTGPVDFIRKSTRPTATWKTEIAAVDKSNITYTSLSMAPKKLGTYTVQSKQFLMETSASVEADVRAELAYSLAEGIDVAALLGTGTSGQPTGVYNAAGTNSILLGPDANNGAALTRANIVNALTQILAQNVMPQNLGWVFNSVTAGKLMDTIIASGSDKFLMDSMDKLNVADMPVQITNAIGNAYSKGTSGNINTIALFGAWENLYINQYGGYDLLVDPYVLGLEGQVRLIIHTFADILVYEPKAFTVVKHIKNV